MTHRHPSNIDCLVCIISTIKCCTKKMPIMTGAGSGHITNLKQSLLETFDISLMILLMHKLITFYCVGGAMNQRILLYEFVNAVNGCGS
jgi:hypothetical protein